MSPFAATATAQLSASGAIGNAPPAGSRRFVGVHRFVPAEGVDPTLRSAAGVVDREATQRSAADPVVITVFGVSALNGADAPLGPNL